MSYVPVRQRPRVTVVSSGRELRGPGEILAPGQIHDSNLPMLVGLLAATGASVRSLAMIPDDAEAMYSALMQAACDADLVVTTAGISVGDEDHVRRGLLRFGGEMDVIRVAMKPGKLLALGRLGGTVFIGLPGNPLATLSGAIAFVRPLLARMVGSSPPSSLQARAAFDINHKPERAEFIPVHLRERDAAIWAERAGPDGSGRLAPLLDATGLAFIAAHRDRIGHGSLIEALPFWENPIGS